MANLIDVARELGTDKECLAYLEKVRWPSGVACLNCGSLKVSKAVSTVKNRVTGKVSKKRYVYDCLEPQCRHQFTATTGTLFHDSHLPLPKWFMAVALFIDAKKSVSAMQMQRHLGVSYRTAWYLCHRIRKAMEAKGGSGFFTGVVEVDETFIGGKYDKRRKSIENAYDKQAVMGIIERGKGGKPSTVRAFPIPHTGKGILNPAIRANVSMDAKMVCTDQYVSYQSLARDGYRHQTVNHIKLEWVRPSQVGLIHTNNIESFWSLFNRGLVGSFHQVSRKHLARYLDEFTYRSNNRHSDLFSLTMGDLIERPALTYRNLIASE